MKLAVKGVTLAALLATGACATNQPIPPPSAVRSPADVGSMTAPATGQSPGFRDPTVTGRDVGSMSTPNARGGFSSRQFNTPDTGSMQLPSSELRSSQPGRITP